MTQAPTITPDVEMRLLDDRLRNDESLWPTQASEGSAAYDLRACMSGPIDLEPNEMQVIPTGVAIHINDPSYCGLIVPRSGLGTKHGIVLANTVGLIDSDYTGELKLAVWNRGTETYTIEPFVRLCQLLFHYVCKPNLKYVQDFSQPSERGGNGFGSTGLT